MNEKEVAAVVALETVENSQKPYEIRIFKVVMTVKRCGKVNEKHLIKCGKVFL